MIQWFAMGSKHLIIRSGQIENIEFSFIIWLVPILERSEAKLMKTLRGQTQVFFVVFILLLSIFVLNHDERNFYRHSTNALLFVLLKLRTISSIILWRCSHVSRSIVNPIRMDVIRRCFFFGYAYWFLKEGEKSKAFRTNDNELHKKNQLVSCDNEAAEFVN